MNPQEENQPTPAPVTPPSAQAPQIPEQQAGVTQTISEPSAMPVQANAPPLQNSDASPLSGTATPAPTTTATPAVANDEKPFLVA